MLYNLQAMNDRLLRHLFSLAEGVNAPPTPERHAKLRSEVQGALSDIQQLTPQITARISALTPRLIGNTISAADATDAARVAEELRDLGGTLSAKGAELVKALGKLRGAGDPA